MPSTPERVKESPKTKTPRAVTLWRHACLTTPEPVKESPSDIGATSKEKNNIVIPEFSAWLTLVLEQCRAENIRNLPRQRAPTPLFPERRPREACSMPISGCHDLPLATFNLPSRVFRHGCRRAECPKRRWGGFFHTLSCGRPAQRILPPPNLRGGTLEVKKTMSFRNFLLAQPPSEQTATTPKPSSFRNLRRKAGHPTEVAAALSRSD